MPILDGRELRIPDGTDGLAIVRSHSANVLILQGTTFDSWWQEQQQAAVGGTRNGRIDNDSSYTDDDDRGFTPSQLLHY
ncbi:unnamed protein product [Gongylonema pulchrum]|uniref:DUF4115 domain-containing protein n=1 Tax=Gongylonema pulchrum TaxID=637853 RepID=A0A183DWJ7_9BILA|nr:unnamed protein product [Gongylonema pulchrum]